MLIVVCRSVNTHGPLKSVWHALPRTHKGESAQSSLMQQEGDAPPAESAAEQAEPGERQVSFGRPARRFQPCWSFRSLLEQLLGNGRSRNGSVCVGPEFASHTPIEDAVLNQTSASAHDTIQHAWEEASTGWDIDELPDQPPLP